MNASFVFPPELMKGLSTFITTLSGLVFETLPFLLIGTSISSAIHVFIPDRALRRFFPKNHVASIFVALGIGSILPICECATVPLARRLREKGLPASTAVLLLLVFRGVSGAISAATDSLTIYMEGFAYCALIAMAAILFVRAIVDLAKGRTHADNSMSLGALVLTGIYPCPGAILILVLSLTLNILSIGIVAVVAMSLGMSLPIVLFAYLGWFGRTGLVHSLKKNKTALRKAGTFAEIAGFAILLVFSIYLALPFIASLARLIM